MSFKIALKPIYSYENPEGTRYSTALTGHCMHSIRKYPHNCHALTCHAEFSIGKDKNDHYSSILKTYSEKYLKTTIIMTNFGLLYLNVLIFLFVGYAFAWPKEKIPINLDVTQLFQWKIRITPSEEAPGGSNFTIQKNSRHTHIIGKVMDGDEVVYSGDPTDTSRFILFVPRENGDRYIRILNRNRTNGHHFVNTVHEFVKKSGGNSYRQIDRTHIDINLPFQRTDNYINVELVLNFNTYQINDTIPESFQTLPIKFSTQKEIQDDLTIGRVYYGRYLLNNEIEGLIYREVTWEGGPNSPLITIESHYKDGTLVEKKYIFERGSVNGFALWDIRNGNFYVHK
ncbi:hypothetical protein BEWA_049990 [Theileria equi strain WA]|uniref:Signal peptide containing protein n=1 Tax=Theileria equi strain WA TaxID=1537102 RepID=L1LB26_THEEQ|nr:hypothetical protein BEWA_049990 [Theileria equi strain WA]EKX72531.1 hypothetical protein BEWA_049990 [Theileria equi strain WA]|eukprot:XP_004831983.1 hypothetical protein BEWA_049990 [Theileria equi strain WA]